MSSSDDDLKFAPVPVEMIDTFWDKALEYLQPAIDTAEGKIKAYDLYLDCQMSKSVLWLVIDGSEIIAALTTRIVTYPNKRGYALEFLGGKQMKRWFNLVLDTLEEVAKHNDCTHFEAYGRKGWQRWLEKRDFKPKFVHYEMEFKDG